MKTKEADLMVIVEAHAEVQEVFEEIAEDLAVQEADSNPAMTMMVLIEDVEEQLIQTPLYLVQNHHH